MCAQRSSTGAEGPEGKAVEVAMFSSSNVGGEVAAPAPGMGEVEKSGVVEAAEK